MDIRMPKKRVHEIAKETGLPAKEVIEKLQDAGLSVKAAASAVDEREAKRILGVNGGAPRPVRPAPDPVAPKQRPTRDSLQGERAPGAGGPGGRRRVVIDSQASRRTPGGPPPPQKPPGRGRRRGRGGRRRFIEQEPAPLQQLEDVPRDVVRVNSGATVRELAEYLSVPVPELIKKLMLMGEMATQNQTLSDDHVQLLATELDKEVEVVHSDEAVAEEETFEDAEADLVERPPVVTIMGHVDHGKTSLLDAMRETEVAAHEAGGITQHIGAYQVHHNGKTVTFLDTPGHQAFTAMRARGARVTDIAVIVVAADDGVKPQTEEAIDHARAAEVPILVAVNKIDKEGAQPERVRAEMAAKGLQPVEWGGETEFVDVSAKTRQGLDDLLETLLVMAEVEELRANSNAEASGTVIESRLDPGRGPVATLLIQRGTLRVGDAIVAGAHWGRVRAMSDFLGRRVDGAGPGMPVEILGFDSVPEAGETCRVVENDRRARSLAQERSTRLKAEALARRAPRRVSLEDLVASGAQELNLVLKADVAGSLEALEDEIAKLPQGEVQVGIIGSGVGGITESDVMLAAASDAIVIGFNVRPVGEARLVAEREGVEIRTYFVIYRVTDDLRAAMEGLLEPEEVEESVGHAEVRQIFRASRVGTIAGSYVVDGRIVRGAKCRLVRDGTIVYTGEIASLRRFHDDVREVASGFECGIVLRDYADIKEGDEIEVFETRSVERELQPS
jgi:translation initiation factor IF-2